MPEAITSLWGEEAAFEVVVLAFCRVFFLHDAIFVVSLGIANVAPMLEELSKHSKFYLMS